MILLFWQKLWVIDFSVSSVSESFAWLLLFLTFQSVFAFVFWNLYWTYTELASCLSVLCFTHLERRPCGIDANEVSSTYGIVSVRLSACCTCMRCWSPSSIASLKRRSTLSWTRVRLTWTAQGKTDETHPGSHTIKFYRKNMFLVCSLCVPQSFLCNYPHFVYRTVKY